MTERRPIRMQATTEDQAVTPLELFFDLVFVFALTQVTALMADHLNGHGVIRGVLIVGLLWWSWIGYAWLCNMVRADEGHIRLVLLAAMAVGFVLALTIPEAFDDLPGGLPGPVVIAVCYFLFRLVHLWLFWVISSDDPVLRQQLIRFAPSMIGGTALLLIASRFNGSTQTWLWAAALVADYGGTWIAGASGWRLRSARHFSERFGLIMIVALGESIVAIGVGVASLPISWSIILASVLGLAVAAGLWWVYFDVTSIYAEHEFGSAPPERQVRLARAAYVYMHFPLMAGVVLLALGMKKVLGDTDHALKEVALYSLYGGVVLYLLGQVGFKWLIARQVSAPRLAAAALLVIATALVGDVPALGQLAVITAVITALIMLETIRYADKRRDVRQGA